MATASRVLSKAEYPVAADTRQRVLDAAATLGFVPNAMARGLARSRSDSVGVVMPWTNAYYAAMMSGIEAAARAHGLTMLLGLTNGDEGRREASSPRSSSGAWTASLSARRPTISGLAGGRRKCLCLRC